MTASEFFRDAVLENRTEVLRRERTAPDLKRLLYVANKASNNLNQLARRLHTDHLAGDVDEETYTVLLTELGANTARARGPWPLGYWRTRKDRG